MDCHRISLGTIMKKIGIVEIARKFGVAPSTVSRAIHGSSRVSDALKKEIMKYVREIEYQPPSPQKNIIGIAFSMFSARGYCPELLLAFRKVISREGLRLEVIMPESLSYLDFRLYRGLAAFLMGSPALNELCERAACPVVTINDPPMINLSNYAVISDDVAGVAAAGNLLFHAGHRRIAMLLCESIRSFNNLYRQNGYKEFCRQRNLPSTYLVSDSGEEQILDALAEIRRSDCTGLILHCGLDPFYLLHKAGFSVPSDLSVVLLHDEMPMEKDPFFHMVVQDYERIAESTLQIIETLIKKAPVCSSLYLPYRVYSGHSIQTLE